MFLLDKQESFFLTAAKFYKFSGGNVSKNYKAVDFLKTDKVLTFSSDDSLSKALSSLKSGHDAAFVISDENKLLGVINPYYVNFHGNFPPTTKLKRCMIMPPKLSLNSSLEIILRNMLESKIYFLPVLDGDKKMLGILSLRKMLKIILKDADLYKNVIDNLRIRPAKNIDKNKTLSQARSMLKKNKISRLPVVDLNGRLKGIITRYDLRMALSDPKNSQGSFSRKGKKIRKLDTEIERFMTSPVVTTNESHSLSDLINLMLEKMVGSVVIVDKKLSPTGVVTYREIIKALLRAIKSKKYALHMNTPKDFKYKKDLKNLLKKKLKLLEKKLKIELVDFRLSTGKEVDMSDKWHELSIRVETERNSFFAKKRNESWRKGMAELYSKISSQIS